MTGLSLAARWHPLPRPRVPPFFEKLLTENPLPPQSAPSLIEGPLVLEEEAEDWPNLGEALRLGPS